MVQEYKGGRKVFFFYIYSLIRWSSHSISSEHHSSYTEKQGPSLLLIVQHRNCILVISYGQRWAFLIIFLGALIANPLIFTIYKPADR
jgi:hypothetical protein